MIAPTRGREAFLYPLSQKSKIFASSPIGRAKGAAAPERGFGRGGMGTAIPPSAHSGRHLPLHKGGFCGRSMSAPTFSIVT